MKSFSRGCNLVFLLVGLVSCQMQPPGGSPPLMMPMPPSSSGDNSCAQYMNCVCSGNNSMVTFYRGNGSDTVLITMTTKTVNGSGWMAVAFSYDAGMDNDSVIDCILLQNGTIIVKNSYNIADDDNMNNTEISEPYLGIQVVNTSYANGTLQCVLRRSITVVSSSNKIFNLTQPYYILIADGPVDSQGNKMYHGNTSRYASPNAVDVTSDFLVPRDRNYFLDTLGNFVTFAYVPSSGEMEFEIQGPVNKTGRWISLGLSNNMYMGDDSVLDCLLLTNNSVVVQNSYNLPNHAGNSPLNSSEGITVIKTSIINGWLYCAFRRTIANFSSPQIYPLDKSYYLLLGDGNLNADGTKVKHGHTPVVSASAVDVRNVSDNVSRSVMPAASPAMASNNACTQPMNCVSFDVNSVVTFKYQPGDAQITINMTTKAVSGSGWMGLGFSYDNLMTDDSVIDCILLKNGTIVVKYSYNVHGDNVEIPDSYLGIQVISKSYTNGTLQCILSRPITVVSSTNQIFNLTQPYYILIATGPILDNGKKDYHGSTGRNVSSNAVNVTSDFLVPRDRHYFLDTLGNFVTFAYIPSSYSSPNSQMGSDTGEMEFEIQGPVSKLGRWISLGLSKDASMSDDSVLDCLLLTNGSVVVQNSYNLPNYQGNQPLNSAEGITVIKVSNSNGWLYCAFRRKITNFSNPQIFPLDKSYCLLLGDGDLNANGTKVKHGHTPVVSASAVDVRTVSGNVSRSGEILSPPATASPPTTAASPPGVSVFQNGNTGDKVMYKLSDDGNSVEFTISGQPQGQDLWIAVGFSNDQKMGDDSVIDCIRLQNGTFIIQNSYNVPGVPGGGNAVVNADGIKSLGTTYEGSTLTCRLTRNISSSNNSRIFPFDRTYYLLLASGTTSASGEKTYHGASRRIASSSMVNLTAYNGNIGSDQRTQLLRAHGCLMITAFVMLMCGAILIARYYKTCWPEDKLCNTAVWFAVHRFIMVLGLFCCAAGFIIIFCYSSGTLNRTFGNNAPSYFWAHGPMGIAVMILIVMNPLIALLRCDPDSDKRWIFNWLHWFVGTCCQVLAGITLFFGIKMGESDNYKLNHYSVFWILIAFVGFHVFIELLLSIERSITECHNKRRFTVTYGMSSPGEPASAVKQAGDVSRESLLFRYFILAMYVLITMGLWLAMIILIGGGFQTGSTGN